MSPWTFHQQAITALAARDLTYYRQLRQTYQAHDHNTEHELTIHTVAISLTYRLGTQPAHTDRDRLARLVTETRQAGPEYEPPPNTLEVEATIRALHGQPHLATQISPDRYHRILRFLLQYLYGTEPDIHNHFDAILEQARNHYLHHTLGFTQQRTDNPEEEEADKP